MTTNAMNIYEKDKDATEMTRELKIEQKDLRDIFIYAFRYTLGRSTYSVSTMATLIKNNSKNLSDGDIKLYMMEIQEAINENRCGMEMDCKTWEHLSSWLELELIMRGKDD